MAETSQIPFGLMIAYLLPGFVGLAGIVPLAPIVGQWLQPTGQAGGSLALPVYALLAAVTVGMIASCFRWLIIDHIHQWTGVVRPMWDDSQLEGKLAAFNYLVQSHYRHYQFVSNMLVTVIFAYVINRLVQKSSLLGIGTDLGAIILCATLFAASRDALSKYYARTNRLIGSGAGTTH